MSAKQQQQKQEQKADSQALGTGEKFRHCVCVINKPPDAVRYTPTTDEKLKFYSLFKQSTSGDCTDSKPSMLNVVAYKKWGAWNNLRGTRKDAAMTRYVQLTVETALSLAKKQETAMLTYLTENGVVEAAPDANTQKKENGAQSAQSDDSKEGDHLRRYRVCHGLITQPPRHVRFTANINEKLALYALFKQITFGDCKDAKPVAVNVTSVKKWEAWQRVKGVPVEEAKRRYVANVVKIAERLADGGSRTMLEYLISHGIAADSPAAHEGLTPNDVVHATVLLKVSDVEQVRPIVWFCRIEGISCHVEALSTLKDNTIVASIWSGFGVSTRHETALFRYIVSRLPTSVPWFGRPASVEALRVDSMLEWCQIRLRTTSAGLKNLSTIMDELEQRLGEHSSHYAAAAHITAVDVVLRCALERVRLCLPSRSWRHELKRHAAVTLWWEVSKEIPYHDVVMGNMSSVHRGLQSKL